ncbi:MAG: TadE/TadG family type IV pilus assembly protein [Parvularculaceae bacterium]
MTKLCSFIAAACRLPDALARCRKGVAAVEFAFIAPVMIVLFFGVIEGSAALSASRKTLLASTTLADLVAQETEVKKSDLDDLFTGAKSIISDGTVNASFTIMSVVLDKNTDQLKVNWSYRSDGAQPYAAGSVYTGSIDKTLLDDTSSLIVAKTDYQYSSPISQHIIGAVTIDKVSTHWPRRTARVKYCVTAGNCTS